MRQLYCIAPIKFHRPPQRGFRSGCFVRSALFHADCSRRPSCFRYCLFEESVDHHSRCWCICGSLFFSKKSVRSRLSVGAFVVRCFFSKKSVRSPISVGAFVGSVLFFHSRLARLWFDLCPNGPVGRVASLPDATRPCAGQVQIGIFRACGRGRRVSDCLCF